MKKILLASTILVGTAGFAAAEVTFTGKGYAGMAWSSLNAGAAPVSTASPLFPGATSTFTPEVTASFTAGMKTTTDGGLEAGANISLDAAGVSMVKDNTSSEFGRVFLSSGGVSDASVYLSGDFGKFTVAYDSDGSNSGKGADGIRGTPDDVPAVPDVTFTYDGKWGDFALNAYYVFDWTGAGSNGDMGAKVTYTMADYTFYVGLGFDRSAAAGDQMKYLFGASASMSGFTGKIDADYDMDGGGAGTPDFDWKVSLSYATGPYSVGAFVQDDGADNRMDFGVNGKYDLGGGVSVNAEYVFNRDLVAGGAAAGESIFALGVSMAF